MSEGLRMRVLPNPPRMSGVAMATLRIFVVLAVCGTLAPLTAAALASLARPGQEAALVVFPYIAYDSVAGRDSEISLSNVTDTPVLARCNYADVRSLCSQDGSICSEQADCAPAGFCVPAGPFFATFQVALAARQPLSWTASEGLFAADLPPESAGTAVPPVEVDPFTGYLLCAVVDAAGRPLDTNALRGTLALVRRPQPEGVAYDAATYSAVGIPAIPGAGNGDGTLVLGGPRAEYAACPRQILLPTVLDEAVEPTTKETRVVSTLAAVACDGALGEVPHSAGLRVTNEFSQFFSTITRDFLWPVGVSRLSRIDVRNQPLRSFFSASVEGTTTGHILVSATDAGGRTDSGILGVLVEEHRDANDVIVATAAFEAVGEGQLSSESVIRLSGAAGTPTSVIPSTPTPTPTLPPTFLGPEITWFGLATAAGVPLASEAETAQGAPVYEVHRGNGFHIVLEARAGLSGRNPANRLVRGDVEAQRPDVQIQANRALGNGDPAVCDDYLSSSGLPVGGVPAVVPPSFANNATITRALNDFACRLTIQPSVTPCTRNAFGELKRVSPLSQTQVCTTAPVDVDIDFPPGDTLLTALWLDVDGNAGGLARIVVRVAP